MTQIALALSLVISSVLLVRTYYNLRGVEVEYRTEDVLTFRTAPSAESYPEDDDLRAFYGSLVERVGNLPGVVSVAATNSFPSGGWTSATYYSVEDDPVEEDRRPVVQYRTVTSDYFNALGLAILEGRTFTDADGPGSPPVAIVNRRFAERYWPGASALGRRIDFGDTTRQIIGVMADHRVFGPTSDIADVVFYPYTQVPRRDMAIVARSEGDPDALVPAVRRAVRAIDPDQPIFAVRTLEESIAEDLGNTLAFSRVMGVLAMVALLLALVGVYGVVSYAVARRVHEMGLRMALGATPGDVRRLVVRRGAALAGLGVGVGLLLSVGATRGLSMFLWGVDPLDPITFVAASIALLGTGVAASWIPARRATRVDPIIALRAE